MQLLLYLAVGLKNTHYTALYLSTEGLVKEPFHERFCGACSQSVEVDNPNESKITQNSPQYVTEQLVSIWQNTGKYKFT